MSSKLILLFHSSIPWLNTSSSLPVPRKCVLPGTRSWPSHLCVSVQFHTCLFWSPALTGAVSFYPGLSPPESAGPSFSFILMSCAPGTKEVPDRCWDRIGYQHFARPWQYKDNRTRFPTPILGARVIETYRLARISPHSRGQWLLEKTHIVSHGLRRQLSIICLGTWKKGLNSSPVEGDTTSLFHRSFHGTNLYLAWGEFNRKFGDDASF